MCVEKWLKEIDKKKNIFFEWNKCFHKHHQAATPDGTKKNENFFQKIIEFYNWNQGCVYSSINQSAIHIIWIWLIFTKKSEIKGLAESI